MHNQKMPQRREKLGLGSIGHFLIEVPTDEIENALIDGLYRHPDGRSQPGCHKHDLGNGKTLIEGFRHNGFVNQGLEGFLDSGFGDLTPDRITHIGLSADEQAVTPTTVNADPAGGDTGVSIKATANTARVDRTVSADQTWTQADVSWPIRKIFLARGPASTDVSNIIGGEGGSAPFDEPFTIDLTNISTWTLQMGVDTTLTAS